MRPSRAIALGLTAALALAACGDDSDSDSGSDDAEASASDGTAEAGDGEEGDGGDTGDAGGSSDGETIKVGVITSGPPNDLAWNQGLVSRATQLEEEGRIELTVVEQAGDASADETIRSATDLAEDGNQIVIGHSFNYGEPMKEIIGDYPDVLFAYAGGIEDSTENLADYDQPFYESAFLAGILAGGITETGVLGGLAGFDIPVCHSMIAAFAEGAKLTYDGEIELLESYIGSWADPAKNKEAVLAQADQGADAFIPCGVEAGAIEGAEEVDAAVIGYVMDQSSMAPEHVLASVVWDLDAVVLAMVEDVESGEAPPAPYYRLGYAEGGTSVAINDGFHTEIPDETMEVYDDYAAQIESGDFEVPYVPE